MKLILSIGFFIISLISFSQPYLNPGGTISTCGGDFFDTGGSGGDYSGNENITTTFCSNNGTCISLNFTDIDLNKGDFLRIYDGPNTSGTLLATYGFTNASVANATGTFSSSTGCITVNFSSTNSQHDNGWVAAISCVACPTPADYTMPTVGINSEYVGSCLVSDCGPFTFADDGDAFGNYSNSINLIYRVFCPNTAGQCMQVTFNSFATANANDYLQVKNGPTQNSTVFTTAPAAAVTGNISGTPATPFSYTSTDPSGCLTFRFNSNGINTAAGWDATMQCVPCAGGPNGTDNNDCQTMTPLCSNAAISGSASGPGIVAEGCTGSDCPAGGENHTNWYTFTAFSSGTLDITIAPNTATGDYDFAIYGPNVTCGALGSPIRCTDSGATGTTGTTSTAGDNTESVLGDAFLQTMNVIAGESYILVVDEWSPNSSGGYGLTFGGTASLDCSVLPVELSEFNVDYIPSENVVDVKWTTETERNNDYFEVERSIDGITYEAIRQVKGAGNTQFETQYYVQDAKPFVGVNYYRLKQVDFDGDLKYSEVKSVNILDDNYDMMSVFPNPTDDATEVVFNSYDDNGAILKLVRMDGKVVVNTPIETTQGGNYINVDLSEQENGVYFIVVVTTQKVYTEKLVIR